MSTVALGADPIRVELHLSRGSDFTCVLHSNSGDWPDTAAITLEVGDATWTATAVGPDATFDIDLAAVDAIIAESPRTVRLWYEDGATRILWGLGPVSVRG
jgi:hypothetical protein